MTYFSSTTSTVEPNFLAKEIGIMTQSLADIVGISNNCSGLSYDCISGLKVQIAENIQKLAILQKKLLDEHESFLGEGTDE